MSGIYLHIPFCRKACHYCDFHFSTSFKTYDAVVAGMKREIEHWAAAWPATIQTIYFGGGTPSTLELSDLQSILELIRAKFDVEPAAEITIEVNPEDVNEAQLEGWLSLGVNRLSMGVQSFFEDELMWMNRNHTASKSVESIRLAQKVGFENITIDLIYGVPVSSTSRWKDNVQMAIDAGIPHVSAYALTVEEKTALAHAIEKGRTRQPDEEVAHQQFLILREMLIGAGYDHYEISNFGKPGWRSVHNSNYWKGVPYLGIGPGAHSFDGDLRRWNVRNNALYGQRVGSGEGWFETERLTVRDRYNEWMMIQLRRAEGISLEEVSVRFGERYKSLFLSAAESLVDKNYVKWEGDRLVLTENGMFLADGITVELMDA